MEIRKATLEDAATISALSATVQNLHAMAHPHIFKPASTGAFPPDEVAAILAESGTTVFLALVDGTAAGYAYVSIVRRPETSYRYAMAMCTIQHISVDEDFQGLGVGRALIQAAKDLAISEGISCVDLVVWAFNEHARTFFESQGFEVLNLRMWTEVEGNAD
ncbi:MAG: GNAT family N-acetyltransferase [Anaerolineae bacterium]|nr:GNAT family N-acetyltransferase [Anaerolineae bacterium]